MLKNLRSYLKTNYVKATFIAIAALFLLLLITNGVPFIYSDGYASYHTASAIVKEGSFIYDERPEHFDYRGHVISERNGDYPVVYPPGSAIFNVPGMYLAQFFSDDDASIYNDYFKATNVHTLAEGSAYLFTATVIGFASIVLLYRALIALGLSKKISLVTTLFGYFSSYAIWYVFLQPSFSHTYEIFGIVVFIWAYSKLLSLPIDQQARYWTVAGTGAGIAVISRPILIIPAIIAGIVVLLSKNWKNVSGYIAGAVPWALILMWYNYTSYGKLITSGYDVIRGETFNFAHFNGHNILLSPYRGWLVYSPIFILALAGFYYLWKKQRALTAIAISSILSLVIIYGFWPSWWGGGSYGSRFLLPAMPFATIGLGFLFKYAKESLRKSLIIFAALALVWSLSLTILYRFTPVAEIIPKDNFEGKMLAGDRYTPIDIFDYHKDILLESSSINAYINKLIHATNGGNSYLPLYLGYSNITLRIDERDPQQVQFIPIFADNTTQPAPESIFAIARDVASNKLYSLTFSKPSQSESYLLNCEILCKSLSNNLTVTDLSNPPSQLPRSQYYAFYIHSQNLEVYFQDAENMFFKGDPIYLAPEKQDYSF